jgi:hypothetical protein
MDYLDVLPMLVFISLFVLAMVLFAVENGYGKVGALCCASTIVLHSQNPETV